MQDCCGAMWSLIPQVKNWRVKATSFQRVLLRCTVTFCFFAKKKPPQSSCCCNPGETLDIPPAIVSPVSICPTLPLGWAYCAMTLTLVFFNALPSGQSARRRLDLNHHALSALSPPGTATARALNSALAGEPAWKFNLENNGNSDRTQWVHW